MSINYNWKNNQHQRLNTKEKNQPILMQQICQIFYCVSNIDDTDWKQKKKLYKIVYLYSNDKNEKQSGTNTL